jgi:hypothetical protein
MLSLLILILGCVAQYLNPNITIISPNSGSVSGGNSVMIAYTIPNNVSIKFTAVIVGIQNIIKDFDLQVMTCNPCGALIIFNMTPSKLTGVIPVAVAIYDATTGWPNVSDPINYTFFKLI